MTNKTKTPESERDIKMFGCEIEILEFFERESIGPEAHRRYQDHASAAMSWLSDAQEQMSHGNPELARQTINRAKWLLEKIVPRLRKS